MGFGANWLDSVISVGGGKPFGFGAVTIDVEPVLVQDAAARYLGERTSADSYWPVDAVRAFRAAVPPPVEATWPALRHALAFGFIADDLVWYPPGPGETKGSEDFDKSFEFFPRTVGLELKNEVRDLVTLPDAAKWSGDQVLDSRAGPRPKEPESREPGTRAQNGRGRRDRRDQ